MWTLGLQVPEQSGPCLYPLLALHVSAALAFFLFVCFLGLCRVNLCIFKAEVNSVTFSEGKGNILSMIQDLLVPLRNALIVIKKPADYLNSYKINIHIGTI